MPRLAKQLLLLVLSFCLLQLSAQAQDASALKQSTAARAASVASLIATRVVREGSNGLLVMVASQPNDQARQVVSDENRDRIVIFKLIASQTGETVDQVAALYVQRAKKLNLPELPPGPPPMVPVSPIPPESCDDLHLAAALKDRFASDEDLKAYHIQVDVTNKTVILSGSVASDLERTRAADIVRLTGCLIASVVNDLNIAISDDAIAARIKKVYASDSGLRNQPIKVEVSHANVVLSGSVSENIIRTDAASRASEIHGVTTVTNNITVVSPPLRDHSGHNPLPPPKTIPSLTGTWTGPFTSCAGGQSNVQMKILEQSPDDITASMEIEMPNATPGTFSTHGVLNTINYFLTLQFSGWQHQPPGMKMGNLGGYVTFTNQGPTSFAVIIASPGCGQISLTKR